MSAPEPPQPSINIQQSLVNTDEVRKASFWIGQIFVLAATICGVYLAANQGFKQAIAYEKLIGEKNNYYLRLSLRNELADNVALIREYGKGLENGGIAARKAPFQLDTFVWDSMKFSSATLETPSELLTESRNFYRLVADIHTKVVGNDYGVEKACRLLGELAEHMENEVIPAFDANVAELKNYLAANGVEL